MNDLQQMIADFLSDHPRESYSSIARRGGIARQTVQALASKGQARQTPHPDTIAALAAGMGLPVVQVRAAAGQAAGYSTADLHDLTPHGRQVVVAAQLLDPERLALLARRARLLVAEMQEEAG